MSKYSDYIKHIEILQIHKHNFKTGIKNLKNNLQSTYLIWTYKCQFVLHTNMCLNEQTIQEKSNRKLVPLTRYPFNLSKNFG